jgi:hypothetical protein
MYEVADLGISSKFELILPVDLGDGEVPINMLSISWL